MKIRNSGSIDFIRSDSKGKHELYSFIMSGKIVGEITLSNGDVYEVKKSDESYSDSEGFTVRKIR
ncbi:hypothetical protein [Pectobacterium zantedeschiae]|uniref:Uncharacterized protein n=1 Tax=Pectobacterium zantedeschiae TaxID=2034769 RepID=A0A9X8P5Y8_9GAMM|nr:hypothetical protein [Pectobacterium zantedeschiae]RYC38200.1 hypothetical protein CTN06_17520 [Pectobacterium zantedeschiae]RYC44845.1 hypothetical protein CLR69_07505 [Pectobacterium zantedeschiae]RYC49997.1 hypothetical protein CTN06_03305 [Pectobacterium zantedeschiae]